jgi:phenylalanyl-tRNA synthetase beta chain
MQISLNWLKEYVDIDVTVDELSQLLTMLGLEIEKIVEPGREIQNIFIGRILDIAPHPDADKLVVCHTDVGQAEPLQIVCGAKNMKAGDRVPTAVIGASLPGGFEIGRRKMRGIESQGMMCSARELGMGEDHSGLMILPEDAPIGADAKKYLGLDDVVFEIEVTPNRGDWASMIGVARELAAYFGRELRIPEINLAEVGEGAEKFSSVTIDDPELCPRYIGRVLTGVTVAPSPLWLCQRLIAAGQRPINNIVDITNYVLLETGHPLHAFDYDLLAENRIVVRRARIGETIKTLDGEKRTLEEEMLVIADARQPQAVAGIMGGAESEVGEKSTRIFLESAVFAPSSVRRTARRLNLLTEAAQHFQRGADPNMAVYAVNRAAMLMQEIAGAQIAPGLLDAHPRPQAVRTVPLRFVRTQAFLGVDIPADRQISILKQLGFAGNIDVHSATQAAVSEEFTVPSWRHDVSMETDLIEEVARFFGYDNIPATVPRVRQSEKVFAPHEKRLRDLRELLVKQGLSEIFGWTFSSVDQVRRAGLSAESETMVFLQNPLTENLTAMRTSLIPGILANAEYNVKRGNNRIATFELGPVYLPVQDGVLPEEPTHLSILLMGALGGQHWGKAERLADLYDLKGWTETICTFFGVTPTVQPGSLDLFQKGMGADIVLDGQRVGCLGKLSRSVQKNFDLPAEAFLMELNLQPLLSRNPVKAAFQALPTYPPSLRDLAVVVDRGVQAGGLLDTIQKSGGELLREVRIFDVYAGKQLSPDKKSIAFSLVFQASDRTLTDADTQNAFDRILHRLEQAHGAALR